MVGDLVWMMVEWVGRKHSGDVRGGATSVYLFLSFPSRPTFLGAGLLSLIFVGVEVGNETETR